MWRFYLKIPSGEIPNSVDTSTASSYCYTPDRIALIDRRSGL